MRVGSEGGAPPLATPPRPRSVTGRAQPPFPVLPWARQVSAAGWLGVCAGTWFCSDPRSRAEDVVRAPANGTVSAVGSDLHGGHRLLNALERLRGNGAVGPAPSRGAGHLGRIRRGL